MEKLYREFDTKKLLYLQELATHGIYSLQEATGKQLLRSNDRNPFACVIYAPRDRKGDILTEGIDIVIRAYGHSSMSDHVEEAWGKVYANNVVILGAGNMIQRVTGNIAVTLFNNRTSSMGTRLLEAQEHYSEFSQPGKLDTMVKEITEKEFQTTNPDMSVTVGWM